MSEAVSDDTVWLEEQDELDELRLNGELKLVEGSLISVLSKMITAIESDHDFKESGMLTPMDAEDIVKTVIGNRFLVCYKQYKKELVGKALYGLL